MSLPDAITTESIQAESDQLDKTYESLPSYLRLTDEISNVMDSYFEALIERIAEEHSLTEEQVEELGDRLCWRLELLPEPGETNET